MSDINNQKQRKEEGFILVTSVVLIAILTILGTVSFLKTNIEVKVSRSSGDAARSLSVANAGLSQSFVEWGASRVTEWNNDPYSSIVRDVYDGTDNMAVYIPTLNPASMADLRAAAAAASATAGSCTNSTTDVLDNYICWADGTGAPLLRVYEMQGGAMNVVANSTWGSSGGNPQVAVWITGFDEPQYDYHYDNPDTGGVACPLCEFVVYALGRSGEAKRLVREKQASSSLRLFGVDAITNAPQYATWQDACDETASDGVGDALNFTATPATTDSDVLVEATQAPYLTGAYPSGSALTSNTNMGIGGKKFRKNVNSTNELTMDSTPMIAYSLHDSATGVRVDWADTTIDTTAADDPDPELPKDIMLSGLSAGLYKMDYFLSGNAQLFQLDAYRWAAEQFTCQDSGDADAANGEFCDKAEALQTAMGSPVPVTGRLTLEQFEQNVRDARPMFGIVRVMYPTEPFKDTHENCVSAGGREVELYDLDKDANKIGVGEGIFHEAQTNSKIMVYGMLLMDYFTDNNGDFYFDADEERLIEPIESVDAYLKIEIPLMINPAVPFNGGAGGDFYTIATTTAPAGSTNNLATAGMINDNGVASLTSKRSVATLASPYDGWFPSTEGLVSSASTSNRDGSMSLMELVHTSPHGDGLLGAAKEMLDSNDVVTEAVAGTLFDTHKDRLNYYYELMYNTTDPSDSFSWPITTAFPTSFSNDFCIGAEDCGSPNHDGDKFHLLFPNGYIHGFKVAMAALDITADEWNNLLSGNGGITITDLAIKHATRQGYDPTALNPFGSPFGTDVIDKGPPPDGVIDAGIANVATIQADQSLYFNITKHASGYGIFDSDFADLPSLAYSGGLIDTHFYNNIGGILYTPGPLEWEPGNLSGIGYVAGSVVTGFGMYNKAGGDSAHQVFVFDPQSVDNISTKVVTTRRHRYAWQELK